jgi:hypothetical protein
MKTRIFSSPKCAATYFESLEQRSLLSAAYDNGEILDKSTVANGVEHVYLLEPNT